MQDLFAAITRANSMKDSEALKNLMGLRAVDSIKPGAPNTYKQFPALERKPFKSAVNPVGQQFNPVLLLKPKILDPRTRERCTMPDRVFNPEKKGPFRVDKNSKEFPAVKISPNTHTEIFLGALDQNQKDRHRFMYPL